MTGRRTKARALQDRLVKHKRFQLAAFVLFLVILFAALIVPLIFSHRVTVVQAWWQLALVAVFVLAAQILSLARIRALHRAIEDTEQPWQQNPRPPVDFDKVWKEGSMKNPKQQPHHPDRPPATGSTTEPKETPAGGNA